MTYIAHALVSESVARSLADAISDSADLGWPGIAICERAAGEWGIEVYFARRPRKAETAALERIGCTVAGDRAIAFAIERLPDIDWVAKSLEGLTPVRAGRFLVHGRHDRHKVRANDIAIEIEAGAAFGTGHHGTTAGCLLAIDRLARTRAVRRALDIGTGSGVLAIAIARAAKAAVLASDIDPVAVRVARADARSNGVAKQVRTVTAGNLRKRIFRENAPCDLVAANILAGPLAALAPEIARLVAPGGTVILSGLLPGQRARIVSAYRGQGMALVSGATLDGWLTLSFARRARRLKA